ncbi:hypothetical protein LUX57_31965 [Actinomadura madurae]|uniref:hypothetical protein n=1 Tax=Actinomadura madurae TaxID=1993 RepID=UPI0020D21BAF|nr:hypothetical protein [Actinomadura madurae]MCP9969224.1 hypothetical protein [Actinomadura madurae]
MDVTDGVAGMATAPVAEIAKAEPGAAAGGGRGGGAQRERQGQRAGDGRALGE